MVNKSFKRIIDPLKITEEDLPLIVFSNNSWGFMSWLIRWRTKGQYNHAMMMIEPGKFASQTNVFKSLPITVYLNRNNRLKFWRFKRLTDTQKKALIYSVNVALKKRGRYDYLGIVGQAIGITKINNPWTNYCSEIVRNFISAILTGLRLHPSPKDLNNDLKHDRYEEDIEVFGYWFDD